MIDFARLLGDQGKEAKRLPMSVDRAAQGAYQCPSFTRAACLL
jgi:hypothetical protein